MKITVQGLDLSEAVMKVVKACANKTTSPILECIKCSAKNDTLTLQATDGEIAILKNIKADVFEEGEICVYGKYFADFIKKLENLDIMLETDGVKMVIGYGDSDSSIQILPADDFPNIQTDISEQSFKICQNQLKDLISKTTFCCSVDDSRPILKGCQYKVEGSSLSVTALDGFRLVTCERSVAASSEDFEIVVPSRTLNEINRMLADSDELITVNVQQGMMMVEVDDTVITSRLYRGDFIKKENIIPKNFATNVTVEKELLEESVERASIVIREEKTPYITLNVSPEGNITVSANSDIGKIQESVPAEVDGKELKISVNAKYLLDAVKALTEENILISFNTSVQPFIVRNLSNKDYLYLILPVRMAE